MFADPLRMKIVTELYRRQMSASRFHAAYGGGSLSRVDHHFKRLAQHGWIRPVQYERGGGRGRPRRVYRAPELAILDNDAWALVPAPLKAECSWRTFEQFAERVKTAQALGIFDARSDRYFTWSALELDELGRSKVIAGIDALFWSLFEEQADATIRLSTTGERPIQTTVGLAAFDSPSSNRHRNRAGLEIPLAPSNEIGDAASFLPRMAKVLGDPLNLKIVAESHRREMSPTQFVNEVEDAPFHSVARRFRLLAESGWLAVAGERSGGRRRGATERFYRAITPALTDTSLWSRASEATRSTSSWTLFEQMAEQVREAIAAGTFDSRPDRHFSWVSLALDQDGWRQVIEAVDDTFVRVLQEQRGARGRLGESGSQASFATVYLAAFESPSPSTTEDLSGPPL